MTDIVDVERLIYVTFQFEWFHRRPDAPEEVAFLRNEHRHMFHVKAKIEVLHEDRELEFILVKRELESQINNMLEAIGDHRSCEMMASWFATYILKRYPTPKGRGISVEVSEDGENGGIVKYSKTKTE